MLNKHLRFLLLFALACMVSAFGYAQSKDVAFENTVYKLIRAFEKNDYRTVNNYIHKNHKLVTIYRIGVANNFSFLDSLDMDNMTQPTVMTNFKPVGGLPSGYKIKYGKLPEYDCGTDSWNKPSGLYTSRNQVDSVFTSAVRHFMEYEMEYVEKEAHITKKQHESYKDMERRSRKVYLLSDEGTLVFSLTWITGKWYLTILDGVAGDCSA